MIKGIQRINDFGVYQQYRKPAEIQDFSEVNIIYGWNYSGKTTLSRLFHVIENRQLHVDYPHSTFEIKLTGDALLTAHDLESSPIEVRVFNSDFIKSNLSWDGEAFEPILLLGDDSIQANETIAINEYLLKRVRDGRRNKKLRQESKENSLRDAKTRKAAQIKQALELVEAFTAFHLNQLIPDVRGNSNEHLLDDKNKEELLKKAKANESDRLGTLAPISINPELHSISESISDFLIFKPAMTNTIQHLVENGELAHWVKEGLEIHQDKASCEFCGNGLSGERLQSLNSHFSDDLSNHENELNEAIQQIEKSKLTVEQYHVKDFYDVLSEELSQRQQELLEVINIYNGQLNILIESLRTKLKVPFQSIEGLSVDLSLDDRVTEAVNNISKLIEKNNQITDQFVEEKRNAVSQLKKHYAAEFCVDEKLDAYDILIERLSAHQDWYNSSEQELVTIIQQLEATISHAQRGREELNELLSKFLSDSALSIEVANIDGQERFRLIRNDVPARNLSEGEKTAIAFAFFLTKLKESPTLEDVVVYIDDPVSSLDSNHIFQINAVIKEFFFWQDHDDGDQWKLKVKQMFFSTHNFEFLGLLKELPIKNKSRCKYYFIKRLEPSVSALINMPDSMRNYSSEYQYLWSVIHAFHESDDKENLELLLAIPNAVRRFIELYTYSKIPRAVAVDIRATTLFGAEKSKRILKLLHYFSHSNNLLGVAQNSDLICDIENVVNDIVELIQVDPLHYNALMESIS